jgi:DNA-binding response OmpR family regulator
MMKMRILVIDDHDETRELITRNFARAAHLVQTASSCAEAARVLAGTEFDIVVLDVMLPDGSGIELCSRLRAQGCTVPVLLLTARGDVRDRVGGLDAGADDYLVKPFALAELIARVRALARRGPILRDRTIAIVRSASISSVAASALTVATCRSLRKSSPSSRFSPHGAESCRESSWSRLFGARSMKPHGLPWTS